MQSFKGDLQIIQFIYRQLSVPLARKFSKTKITPNQLTVLSALFGIMAGIFFSTGLYSYIIIGSVLVQLSLLLDYTDGTLARLNNKISLFGHWMDCTADRLVDFCVISGIVVGLYKQLNQPVVWVLGGVFLGMRFVIDSSYFSTLLLFPFFEKIYEEMKNSKDLKVKIARQFIYTRTSFLFLATIFGLFNQLFLYVMILSSYSVLWFLTVTIKNGFSVRKHEEENFKENNIIPNGEK